MIKRSSIVTIPIRYYSNPVFNKKVRGQKHPWEVDKYRNSSPYFRHFMLSKYSSTGQTTSDRKGQATISHPFIHQLNIPIHVAHPINQISGLELYINASVGNTLPTPQVSVPIPATQHIWNWWLRNIIITVISDHLSHVQGRWLAYFSFTNWKQRPNGHVTVAIAHHRVNMVAALTIEIIS